VTDWPDAIDAEFALLLRFLLYTGLRLGEALALRWSDVELQSGTVWVQRKKGGIASDIRMRAELRERLEARGPQEPNQCIFRFHQGGDLKHKLTRAKLAYLGLACPVRRPPE
jgi:integrase